MNSEYTCKNAVLFLTFNRLDTAKQVLEQIRKARPPRLYFASDGPRSDKTGENAKVKAVQDYVLTHVDWDCEVKKLLRQKNLGCKKAVEEAITWFFDNETQGIILEDDCLPADDFFIFMDIMLDYHSQNKQIGMVAGHIAHYGKVKCKYSYYADRLNTIWGWATWRRAWEHYDKNLTDWPDWKVSKKLETIFPKKYAIAFDHRFTRVYNQKLSSWATAWSFTCIKNDLLCLHPTINLVTNIGYGMESTHTMSNESIWDRARIKRLALPIEHPDELLINMREQNKTLNLVYRPSLLTRAANRIKKSCEFNYENGQRKNSVVMFVH